MRINSSGVTELRNFLRETGCLVAASARPSDALACHLHFDIEDLFFPTAMQCVVGSCFLFRDSKVVIG